MWIAIFSSMCLENIFKYIFIRAKRGNVIYVLLKEKTREETNRSQILSKSYI